MAAGILAAALFFWLYGQVHPLSVADNSYGDRKASVTATNILSKLGYSSGLPPVTQFKTNSSLVDSLQKQTNFQQFYRDEQLREKYPAFYWSSSFKVESLQSENIWDFTRAPAKTIDVILSEKGELLAIHNQHELFPSKNADLAVLYSAIGDSAEGVSQLRTDSLVYQQLQFQFSELENDSSQVVVIHPDRRNFLKPAIAKKIADYYFQSTGWPVSGTRRSSTWGASRGSTGSWRRAVLRRARSPES